MGEERHVAVVGACDYDPNEDVGAIAVAIAAFLLAFLIVPVLTVIYVAFTNSDGSLTL